MLESAKKEIAIVRQTLETRFESVNLTVEMLTRLSIASNKIVEAQKLITSQQEEIRDLKTELQEGKK